MAPLPWARMWRSSCFMQAQTPRRLTALTRSKSSAGSSAASLGGTRMPALLNAMSSRPNVSTVAVDHGRDLSSSDTSQMTPSTWWPAAVVPRGGTKRGLVDVGEGDGGPCFGEGARGGKAHAGAGTGDEGDLAGEVVGGVHDFLMSLCSAELVSDMQLIYDIA